MAEFQLKAASVVVVHPVAEFQLKAASVVVDLLLQDTIVVVHPVAEFQVKGCICCCC